MTFYSAGFSMESKEMRIANTVANQEASNPLNYAIPYSDVKNTTGNLIKSKWQEHWNMQSKNKLNPVKPTITLWPSLPCWKIDVLVTRNCSLKNYA